MMFYEKLLLVLCSGETSSSYGRDTYFVNTIIGCAWIISRKAWMKLSCNRLHVSASILYFQMMHMPLFREVLVFRVWSQWMAFERRTFREEKLMKGNHSKIVSPQYTLSLARVQRTIIKCLAKKSHVSYLFKKIKHQEPFLCLPLSLERQNFSISQWWRRSKFFQVPCPSSQTLDTCS